MVEMLVYTPKGLKTIRVGKEKDELSGRIHKIKNTRFLHQGQYYIRHTLLRAAEKLITKDKKGEVIEKHTNWGIAMKEDEKTRKVVPELDVVVIKGVLYPAQLFERRK